jgi:hypothetical protein
MSTPETIERELIDDLASLDERFMDEEFSTELYRALANNVWRKDDDGPDGHVSLSWGRAESIVNELRERHGLAPLTLAQTGGEGEVSPVVREELERLGWRSQPLNTSRQDPQHLGQEPEQGRTDDRASDWEGQAHAEAEQPGGVTHGDH